jgi:hypothetical protein
MLQDGAGSAWIVCALLCMPCCVYQRKQGSSWEAYVQDARMLDPWRPMLCSPPSSICRLGCFVKLSSTSGQQLGHFEGGVALWMVVFYAIVLVSVWL